MNSTIKSILAEYDKQGISTTEAVGMTGLSESTWRRFKSGKDVNFDTVARAAEAIGMDISGQESTDQSADSMYQDRMDDMRYMYERHINTITTLYERCRKEDKRKIAILVIAVIILSILLGIYLLHFDARNGDWGFIRF